jgi:hypothetical protein
MSKTPKHGKPSTPSAKPETAAKTLPLRRTDATQVKGGARIRTVDGESTHVDHKG